MTAFEYSWHAEAWGLAHAGIARGAHALLIAGARGLGKRAFSLRLAASYLCDAAGAEEPPCGACESCRWLSAGTHPDFALLEPPKGEEAPDRAGASSTTERDRPIGVDQIRQLGELLALTGHREAGRVLVIHPAEGMNPAAANALLKNLEEPPARTLFILVSHRPAQLPATVRSRCQTVYIRLNDRRTAHAWLSAQGVENAAEQLALCGGAPLEAQAAATGTHGARRAELLRSLVKSDADGVVLAEQFRDLPLSTMLSWLQKWTYDLMCLRFCGQARYHVDLTAIAARQAAMADPQSLSRLYGRLLEHNKHIHHPLNPRLLAERILIDCCQVYAATESCA